MIHYPVTCVTPTLHPNHPRHRPQIMRHRPGNARPRIAHDVKKAWGAAETLIDKRTARGIPVCVGPKFEAVHNVEARNRLRDCGFCCVSFGHQFLSRPAQSIFNSRTSPSSRSTTTNHRIRRKTHASNSSRSARASPGNSVVDFRPVRRHTHRATADGEVDTLRYCCPSA